MSVEQPWIVGDVVYNAMIDVANVPANDKFQIITRHDAGEMVYPSEGYLGINYTDDLVIIQVVWNEGRSIDVKKAFYKKIADGVAEKTSPPISCCGTPELREGLQRLEQVGDAPQAAGEPGCHAA